MFFRIKKHVICVIAFLFLTLLGVIGAVTFTQEKQTAFATVMENGNFRVYDGSGAFHSGYEDISSAWGAAMSLSFKQVNDEVKTATVKMFADAEVADTLDIYSANFTVALDLNGHKLSISTKGESVINSSGTFTLLDSDPTATNSIISYARGNTPQTVEISGGVITGATGNSAVLINGGAFNMQGGTVAGNVITYKWGGAVNPGVVFTMTGGAITENVNTAGGVGGMHVQGVSVKLSGTIKIDGNTSCTNINDSERAEGNFGFDYNAKIVVNGALNDGAGNNARIGLTLMDDYAQFGATISRDYKTYHEGEAADKYFYSDNYQKCPQIDYYGGEVVFSGHSGFKNYENEGDKHSAVCNNCGVRITSEHSYSSSGKCACSAQAAASVGNSFYTDIEQAWAAAKTAGTATIIMFDDASLISNLFVSQNENTNITLDLNGHTVTGTSGNIVFNINSGNTFVLKDSAGGGKITGGNNGVYVGVNATFTMEGGEISGNGNNGTYCGGGVSNDGTFTMNGGVISGNTAEQGGGVSNGGTFTMNGGTIKGNAAVNSGGGVCVKDGGKFNVSGIVQIFENTVDNKANNVQFLSVQTITVVGNLDSNATIGVYMESAGNAATGYSQSEDPTDYFVSDNDKLNCIYNDNGTVKFAEHDFANGTYQCTAEEHWKVCANCDVQDESNKTAHSGGTATCTKKAVCSVCNSEYGVLTAHVAGAAVQENLVDATCVQKGSYDEVTYCVGCGAELCRTEKTIEKRAHTYGNWEITLDATCSAQGSKKHGCTACNHEETQAIAIDADAHSFSEWTESERADCTHKGEETRVCAYNIGHKQTRETDALGHTWGPDSVRVEPTCTTDGSVTGTCTVCNETDIEILVKLGHDLVQHEAQAATCTQIGWNAYESCSRCEHTTYAEIAALRHDFSTEFTLDKAASCTEKGSKSKHCTRCEEKTEVTEIPLSSHTLSHVDRAEATVTANGNIAHWACAVCEKKFSDENAVNEIENVIIPMLKAELVKPNENGGEHKVIVTTPNGFAPDTELVVTEIAKENYAQYDSVAQTVNGEINLVYDVTLQSGGVTVQPDGTLTIKLRIPENLQGKNFKLFHLHESEAADMEYTINGNYAVVNTDRLSDFIFVGEKAAISGGNGLSAGAIAGITIGVIAAVLLAVYVALYFALYRKGNLKGEAFDVIYTPMNAVFNKKAQNE